MVETKGKSHLEIIVDHLKKHKTLTNLEAIGVYRIFNIRGRISDLRKAGHNIITTMKKDATGKSYASYSLA